MRRAPGQLDLLLMLLEYFQMIDRVETLDLTAKTLTARVAC